MIYRGWNGDKWLLTTQPEHGRIAGIIAAGWNFGLSKPRDEVLLAITRHDDGWKGADAAPEVTSDGRPVSFHEKDAVDRLEIWSRSVRQLYEDRKFYAARLVAAHVTYHARNSLDNAKLSPRAAVAVGNFIGEMTRLTQKCMVADQGRQTAVREILAKDPSATPTPEPDDFESDLRFLQICDLLSLILCGDFAGETTIPNVPYMHEGTELLVTRRSDKLAVSISPLPFRKNLRDHLSAIIIPRRRYESSHELREVVQNTKPTTIEFHFGGATEPSSKVAQAG
ncbi:MAG: DUF3891 family protein [Candidatus Sumerlaeaceae bacterium]|nr:DUF3891 family protein [Candidatus Sumerlaeaceae bacterium]